MLEAVVFLLTVAVVGGLLFLGGALLLGRAETRPPADPDRSPLELPEDRPVTSEDVRGVRLSVVLRGYRMTEVDWLLDHLAEALRARDAQIAALRARADGPGPAVPGTDPAGPAPSGTGSTGPTAPGTDGAPAGGNGARSDA